MASIKKDGKVWRVRVKRRGIGGESITDSGTFDTKREAEVWAAERESQIRQHARSGIAVDKAVLDVFRRYAAEVSPRKRGCRYEQVRLQLFEGMPLARVKLGDLNASHIAAFRDLRLRTISNASVNREMNLISHCFAIARKEWKWLAESPTKDVSRPRNPPARCRRISQDETDRLCFALGFAGEAAHTKSQRVAVAFLFAIETAMRLGEICNLQRGDRSQEPNASYLKSANLAHLGMTKNGYPRDVPLSPRAVALLKLLPLTGALYFGMSSSHVDPLFRKAKERAGITDLHFHDARHEAISRLVRDKKMNVTTLAAMVGHRNLNELMTYYNPTEQELETLADTL